MTASAPFVYIRRERYDDVTQHDAFGIRDRKGREIGAFACSYAVRVTLDEAPKPLGYIACGLYQPGATVYAYSTRALRDGVGYGASSYDRSFATAAERNADVARYFEDARKRAEKIGRDSDRAREDAETLRAAMGVDVSRAEKPVGS